MTRSTSLIFLAAAVLLTGCEWVNNVISGEVVATVGKEKLYRSDLDKALPSGVSGEDSTRLARQYINTWASDIVFMEIAEQQLSKEELDVSRELEDYRKSLLKYRYEQRYVNDRLDTAVTPAQIEEYYNSHPEKFRLSAPVVKADYVCIPPASSALKAVRKAIVEDEVPQMRQSDTLAWRAVIKYEDFGKKWIDIAVLAREFGLEYPELLSHRSGEWIEYDAGEGVLNLAYIRDFTAAGQLCPLEYATPLIRDILLSVRKRALVSGLEQDLLKEARENERFVIVGEDEEKK